jgi:two-component system chemotaxis sensor kinase CheA
MAAGAERFRDQPLTMLRLPDLLAPGLQSETPVPTPLVVVSAGGRRFGLLLDGLQGQGEAVVKNFDAPTGTLPIFSGATLLDDGRPALILDAERLAALA